MITRKRKIIIPYRVVWGNGNDDIFETLDDCVLFIRNNHLEAFSVFHDDTDLTSVVISILGWLK